MEDEKIQAYLIFYKKDGKFHSFNSLEIAQMQTEQNKELDYIGVSEDVHNSLLLSIASSHPIINIDALLNSDVEIINAENKHLYINAYEPDMDLDFNTYKFTLISNLKKQCGNFINNGLYLTLSNSAELKHFTYKLEDQINIKSLIDNAIANSLNEIYYKPSDGNYELYTLESLQYIYQELEKYKNYNLIYVDVLCNWIDEKYTLSDYLNKDVISYGYSNNEILARVGEIYGCELL